VVPRQFLETRYGPKAVHTKAYERHLIVQLVNSTLSDVGAKEDVTVDALLGVLDRWVTTTVDWEHLEPFATLGIDEIARTKGHRDFVAVISAKGASGSLQVLAVLPNRLKATVVAWLRTVPESHRQQIRSVCTDM
jgi:transposase